jgi:hypothetical protein
MITLIGFITFTQILSTTALSATPDYTWMETIRRNCRQGIMGRPQSHGTPTRMPFYSPILENDRAEDLVEVPSKLIRNIQQMDQNKMLQKELTVTPWSDSYWPLYLGSLGQRYDDQKFTGLDWKEAKSYISKNSVADLIQKKSFDSLSPSEKYDFLLGLTKNTLTESSWAEGEQYYREYGSVETWMGLCHGWAAASIMMPNPKRKVPVKTTAGTMTFYPSDIKALGTLLWAKGNAKSRFIGGRCNEKDPATDSTNRPKPQECLDNNPGTWHLTIVNQIGQFNRSFVMDATYDYQVWNQPVFGYQYFYYNPKTGKNSAKLSDALVSKTDWTNDPRRAVRASNTKSLVGIKMIVTYVIENSPNKDENQESEFATTEYDYDLELNDKMEIIGGEWYSDNHPDFLWVPDARTFPGSFGDSYSVRVDLNNISAEVKNAAAYNAAYELPFGAVVRAFFNASSRN